MIIHPFFILLAVFAMLTLSGAVIHAQTPSETEAVYQWSVSTGDRDSRAFLWVPSKCSHVRGILLAPQVILEKQVCDDPLIREACVRQNLAIIVLFRKPDNLFPDLRSAATENQSPPAKCGLQIILDRLAHESGYEEVSTAPLLTVGHSGGAIFAWHVAYAFPERALGVVGLHSSVILPPDWAPKATPVGFPALCISGEYEWGGGQIPLDRHWRWLRGGVLDMRGRWDAQICELVQPGATHFSWDVPLSRFVARFIEKAATYRIKDDGTLQTLPMESGWLTDINLLTPSRFAPAPYAKFGNDPTLGFWHMDEELARFAEAFPTFYGGKTDQRVTFVQTDKLVPAEWIEKLPFEPQNELGGDSMTLKVRAAFLDRTPDGAPGSGVPLGHASGPIQFRLIGGWGGGGEQVGPDTFRIRFDHFGISRQTANIQIMAFHKGDAKYKTAEQPCQIDFPEKNTTGTPQTIAFPVIGSVSMGIPQIPLHAISDSGLPVSYFVRSGPAYVKNGSLVFTPIPPKARFPVQVIVVAYQWGRAAPPLMQSATPVEQTVLIEKPASQPASQVAHLSDLTQSASLGQEWVYKTVNGEALKFFVFAPPGKSGTATPHPALVWIHGGGWTSGDASVFFPHDRYFATRGAAAISINYRLTKRNGPQISDSLADCKTALRYIRAYAREWNLDAGRIAVLGDSAGGHLAAALAAFSGFDDRYDDLSVPTIPNAIVLFNPIVDMTEGDWVYHAALGETPKRKEDKPAVAGVMLDTARCLSPLFHVHSRMPPIVLGFRTLAPDAKAATSTTPKSLLVPQAGEPLLLVRALGNGKVSGDASSPHTTVSSEIGPPDKAGVPQFYDGIAVNNRGTNAQFRVLLIPCRAGEPLPHVTYDTASQRATVAWPNSQDQLRFSNAPNEKSRVTVSRGGKTIVQSH